MLDEGEKHSLTQTKLQKLAEVGFDWGKRKGDYAWEERYRELVQFKQQFGSCKCISSYDVWL